MRLSLLILALVAVAAPARAQFIPMVGYDFDYEAAQVGVGYELGVTPGFLPASVGIRPSVEYVFVGNNVDVVRGNLDLIARFHAPTLPVAPYGKAGVAVEYVSAANTSNTEVGLNLGAGVEINQFLVEGTLGIGNISSGRIAVGYRF